MQTKARVLAGLVAALILAVAAPVAAQGWSVQIWGGGPRVHRQGEHSRLAYDNGYRQGVIRGEHDARSGRMMGYRDDRYYRSGDWGFTIRFGSRSDYRLAFRAGFEAGYRDGFARFGRHAYGRVVPRPYYPDAPTYPNGRRYQDYGGYGAPGSGNYGGGQVDDIAFRNGYADGIEKGEKDARSGKPYDLRRHDWYRDGDRRYDDDYGPRDRYQAAYREGFRQGYDAAFGGGDR